MKKWLFIGVFTFLLVAVSLSIYFISEAINTGKAVGEQYLDIGMKQTPLVEITGTDHYYGTVPLIILYGKDEFENEMVVWMNEDLSMVRHAWIKDSVGKEKIANTVKSNYEVEKEIHIIPGMENNFFVWEALFKTKSGEFFYAYYDFFTGELLRSITLKNH